jgi:excinuclease ABC subunit C
MKRLAELRERVRSAAASRPGVYRMLGPAGEVLYIGKSVRVRQRLLSYFRARRGEKAAEIVGHAHGIEWDYVPSEFAALLHEFRLIKRHRPPYNVEHKRDRAYCFIKLTRESAPRLLVVDRALPDGATYWGPFRGRARVREAIREISDLLELRDCAAGTRVRFADQLEIFRREDPPGCMRADVGRCLAPCAGRVTQAQYTERVGLAHRFLEGDAERPLAVLRERMNGAADRLQFEYAAELRDRAQRLEEARAELLVSRRAIEALSLLYGVAGFDGEDRWYLIRRGRIRAEVPAPASEAGRTEAAERIAPLLAERESELAMRGHDAAEVLLVTRWFRNRPDEWQRTVPLAGIEGAKLSA